ncbi:hypothetical protein B0T11DRAFT_8587 [Plectosphaerella cucumerina]|uniref:Uncharacterized protein n=1 Tax=Plectosphaerella cucumerina TaxID=40658 RepID=A0A8K0TN38_9PEZI|nr:hypothetical protein B0T11DRAFT_8587 [Plectosphaerella cucumerina]
MRPKDEASLDPFSTCTADQQPDNLFCFLPSPWASADMCPVLPLTCPARRAAGPWQPRQTRRCIRAGRQSSIFSIPYRRWPPRYREGPTVSRGGATSMDLLPPLPLGAGRFGRTRQLRRRKNPGASFGGVHIQQHPCLLAPREASLSQATANFLMAPSCPYRSVPCSSASGLRPQRDTATSQKQFCPPSYRSTIDRPPSANIMRQGGSSGHWGPRAPEIQPSGKGLQTSAERARLLVLEN